MSANDPGTATPQWNVDPQSSTDEGGAVSEQRPETLVLLPVRETVLFPELVMPIAFARQANIAAAQAAMRAEQPVGLVLQKDASVENPGDGDLHGIGTAAHVLRYLSGDDRQHHLVCQGLARFRIRELLSDAEHLSARVEWIEEPQTEGDKEIDARLTNLRQRALEALELLPQAPRELINAMRSIPTASLLTDAIAGYLGLRAAEKQEILETLDLPARMDRVQSLLDYRVDVLRLSREINQQTQERVGERQREAMLREQLHSIQKELGEDESRGQEVERLREALNDAGLPEDAHKETQRELKRLERIPEASAEYSMVRTYLELMAELPWSRLSEDQLDIDNARRILNEDHYGLDKVKRRILEHLAVHRLNPEGKSPILCFVGPPGVGKTSLGRSIARAMGRGFVRASLGGIHDEAEIRGHRRTYVGALPGNIIDNLRKAGTRNPVFMLDEMDKLSASFHGDPASALLEVLDPEQNDSFRDSYLGVPFDLSKVMFIGTANVLDSIPGPLRDRMEVIELPGYSRDEKAQIARKYLIGRQIEQAGLSNEQCELSDEALASIISDYTREAGLRNLEREIGAVVRHIAVRVAEGDETDHLIGADDLRDILGPRRFESEIALRTSVPGVATGLAWTPHGGDILFIEASRAPGNGRLILTGQLGDVMKESVRAALTLVKSRAEDLGIDTALFKDHDIHVHIPAGAIRKDGPSAGVAVYTALVSLLTDRTVRPEVAMTGEISLRGQILPIGGVKEKTLAAHQSGIKTVLLPERNRKDEDEIPENIRAELEVRWMERVDQAIDAALTPAAAATAQSP
ncbi:MAG: endopeptidase La [Salinisphaera sp.]|nr:endopeptidase La [Salinisphaera sp.]